jgi:hypothetical protein
MLGFCPRQSRAPDEAEAAHCDSGCSVMGSTSGPPARPQAVDQLAAARQQMLSRQRSPVHGRLGPPGDATV